MNNTTPVYLLRIVFFLNEADFELRRIHQKHSEKIREADAVFFSFWSAMIDDMRQYIAIGIKTLEFQQNCPPHMLVDEANAQSFPLYAWTTGRANLMEIIVALHHTDVIRQLDGKRPAFADFAKEIGGLFGVTFKYPNDEMRKIISRKKNKTPFLNKVIFRMREKNDNTNL